MTELFLFYHALLETQYGVVVMSINLKPACLNLNPGSVTQSVGSPSYSLGLSFPLLYGEGNTGTLLRGWLRIKSVKIRKRLRTVGGTR